MSRGIGYCINEECEHVYRDIFVVSPSGDYRCIRCRVQGKVELERGSYSGLSQIFNEVRVNFNFDAKNESYRETAIVKDDALVGDHNVYTLRAPMAKTSVRALKLAESLLGNLNRYSTLPKSGEVPQSKPFVISFDASLDDIRNQCNKLSRVLQGSPISYWRDKYDL